MKILYVTGYYDYGALMFEESFGVDHEEIKAIKIGETKKFQGECNGEDYDFIATMLEFSDIDPEFIKFIRREIMDYDLGKNNNFYVIKD
jgi:hypothetical protein